MDLGQGRDAIVEEMKNQSHQRQVERVILQPGKGLGEIMQPDLGAITQTSLGQLDHVLSVIEGHDFGALLDQLLYVPTSRTLCPTTSPMSLRTAGRS